MAAHVLVLYNEPHDPTAFEQYYHGTHIPIVKRLPGLRSYTVSRGSIVSPAGAPPYYFAAVLAFDSMAELQSALSSPEGEASAADLPKFATGGVTVLMYDTQEV